MHWPVMVMYPENMQQDAIEDFCERDTFTSHLDVMFGPEAPPLDWDVRKEYSRDRVELYFLCHAGESMHVTSVL